MRTWQYSGGTKAESPRSPKSPARSGSFKSLLRKNSLRKCTSEAELRVTGGGDEEQQPRQRQRRVLRKNPNPSMSRSESRLLLQVSTKEEPGPRRNQSTSRLKLELFADDSERSQDEAEVYWPLDLLPSSCPNTRILTWGCQTLATNGKLLPAQHNLFTHADDLLHDLATLRDDTRTAGRAVIFVTHSLGGVIVKEVGFFRRIVLAESVCFPN